jgi:NADPH:quinone reductase-like Zn-dependent oxidoreductase
LEAEMIANTIHATLLTDHGGIDKLEYRMDVPVPHPTASEALIHVPAAKVNNTDNNTRIGSEANVQENL